MTRYRLLILLVFWLLALPVRAQDATPAPGTSSTTPTTSSDALPASTNAGDDTGRGGVAVGSSDAKPDSIESLEEEWTVLLRRTPDALTAPASDIAGTDSATQRARQADLQARIEQHRAWRSYWDAQRALLDRLIPLYDEQAQTAASASTEPLPATDPRAAAVSGWREVSRRFTNLFDRLLASLEAESAAYDTLLESGEDSAAATPVPTPTPAEPPRDTFFFGRERSALSPYRAYVSQLDALENERTAQLALTDRSRRDAIFYNAVADAARKGRDAARLWPDLLDRAAQAAADATPVFGYGDLSRELRNTRKRLEAERDFAARERERLEALVPRLVQEAAYDQAAVADGERRAERLAERAAAERRRLPTVLAHTAWETLTTRGVWIVAIVVIAYLLVRLIRPIGRIFVKRASRVRDEGEVPGSRQRAQTLVDVFGGLVKVLIVFLAALMLLEAVGINITPLLGAFAILGLAVSFGSQNLVKDVVTGFFIILEGQLSVGHIVKLGEVAGVVESVSLRRVVLRDVEGVYHSVPCGQIGVVSNLTSGWARVVLHVGVAYDSPLRRVREVLNEVGAAMYKDSAWRDRLIEAPSVAGIEELGDSAIVFRVWGMVHPAQQWDVKRELNLRIKEALDAEGIEIPFPQRTVWMQQASTEKKDAGD